MEVMFLHLKSNQCQMFLLHHLPHLLLQTMVVVVLEVIVVEVIMEAVQQLLPILPDRFNLQPIMIMDTLAQLHPIQLSIHPVMVTPSLQMKVPKLY